MSNNKRRQYTRELKQEAVELVTKQQYTIAQAASSLGINSNMLTVAGSIRQESTMLFRAYKWQMEELNRRHIV